MTTKIDDVEHAMKKREREKSSNKSSKRSKKEDSLLEAVKSSLNNIDELENILWEEKRKRDLQKVKAVEPVDGDLTPLHFGAIFGHLEITELLFQRGFKDVNAINEKDEYMPLHYVCKYGHAEVATFLISKEGIYKNKFSLRVRKRKFNIEGVAILVVVVVVVVVEVL